MMQASTSLMLRYALTRPGMAPHSVPANIPLKKAKIQIKTVGTDSEGMFSATYSVAAVLMRYCPGAPMLKRPVLNATATERPVRIRGVARKSMLPMLVGLKPKVSVPAALRPVENSPPNTRRIPSHALERPSEGFPMPTSKMMTLPTTRPMTMEISEERTALVPSLAYRLESFSLMPFLPPLPSVWRRPCRGPAPALWWSWGPARPRSLPRTSQGSGRPGS